ncbi:ABC transporter ATP-binding protein [Nocardia sp. CDC159]|uniref:ABC transporter ATP-binding protein n=1 Tax=Nocardia pulmonis TaxID=2951408 RepID=A0A9X2E9G2_9NOCA|nr:MULTISPECIES: ABC transporter ATP-binding protein [Nocardia]MCM6773968.1 ABC transporter ATP-binding protein [Nocardia pulmonis]MCM6786855.1 ABC transporter ATP-binding protein [Nocardia sp. CDC159]
MTGNPQLPVLRTDAISVTFGKRDAAVAALDGVDLAIAPASFTVIMGPSGSGKTTLLSCLSGLLAPTSGTVHYGDTSLYALSDPELSRLRLEQFGFVFQEYGLLESLSARGNILLPARAAGKRVDRTRLAALCDDLGITRYLDMRPDELSGGTQQRVACARALIAEPRVIFADEPTGALDTHNAGLIRQLLRRIVDERDISIVAVTHDPQFVEYADRVLLIRDGRIEHDLVDATVEQVVAHSQQRVAV